MMARAWLVALGLLLAAACSREHGYVAPTFQRMLTQPKYEPYGRSAFFPDNRAMRAPPVGTVPRERDVGQLLLTTGAASGTFATRIPVSVTADLLAAGRSRFSIYCAVCHGARGDGRSVVASNMPDCPPPSLVEGAARLLPPGAIYQIIDRGFGRMPPYTSQLSVRERWAVVAYLRSMQHQPASGDSIAPAMPVTALPSPACRARR
jgi:mono/diheme cytochrome c family protein